MVQVRRTVEIGEGVKVDLLFTPRLSIYTTIERLPEGAGAREVFEQYADIMYAAALNAWELDGHGTVEEFPHKRGDFHAWMAADPGGFAKAVNFAVSALTGKKPEELIREEEKRREMAGKAAEATGEEVKKKRWLYRITHRSRRSS